MFRGVSLTIAVIAALAVAVLARQAELVEVQASSTRFAGLHDQAMRFFRAVSQIDKPTLAAITVPGARAAVRKDLDSPTSALSKILLTGSFAMRGRFMSVATPTLTLLRMRDATADDPVIACFSDPRQAFKRPATTAALPPLDSNRAEFCVPFVPVDRRWAVSYEFVDGAGR